MNKKGWIWKLYGCEDDLNKGVRLGIMDIICWGGYMLGIILCGNLWYIFLEG